MKKVKGLLIEIGGDTSALQKSLSQVNKETNSLSKELKGINTLLKFDPKNTVLLEQKQAVLNKEITKTKDKLSSLKEAQDLADNSKEVDKSSNSYRNLQREIINTEIKLQDLNNQASNWTKASKALDSFGSRLTSIGNGLNSLGGTLTKSITVPVMALGTVSIKSAKDFESAFAGVEKTVDGTVEQMASLKQGIRSMAKELPSTTEEISGVAEAAGQLGIKTENILDFSKTMIDFGNSTNVGATEGATSIARLINIMQSGQDKAKNYGSTIVDLGNKFATTEGEIINMSLRLAGAGKQVGMSEAQVLGLATALSSVGIEAEMGGSAFSKVMVKMQVAGETGFNKLIPLLEKTGYTLRDLELMASNDSESFKDLRISLGITSKELKGMMTAGRELDSFATIAGTSVENFAELLNTDVTKAITMFIKGLGDTEDVGESAIAMLQEMGLTEVRLRDALLRAANAGTLFNDAIDTGTKAWEDNVALTNEANKRYETTESRIKMTINKFKDLGITMGEQLLPHINDLLEHLGGLAKDFSKLTKEEQKSIIKTTALVAGIGPLLSILGKVSTITSKVTSGLSTFTKAISLTRNGIGTATGASANLAKGLSSLTGQLGLTAVATTALIAGISALDNKLNESFDKHAKSTDKFISKITDQNNARKENINVINDQLDANLSEISNVERLRSELNNLVDENGKVKDGYKSRVDFILNELNKALGTEYSMTGDVINRYRDLKSSIDEVILAKKAQIILEADEEKYKNAIKNKTKLYEDYLNTQKQITKTLRDIEEINKAYYAFEGSRMSDRNKAIEQYKELTKNLTEQGNQIKQFNIDIQTYEENSRLAIEGGVESYKKIESSITKTIQNITNIQKTGIDNQLKNSLDYVNNQKKYRDIDVKNNIDANNSIYQQNVDSGQKNIDNLISNLQAQTSTIGDFTPEVISAWYTLANNSRDKYKEAISKLPPDTQNQLNQIVGITLNNTSVEDASRTLGLKSAEAFNQNKEAEMSGKYLVRGLSEGINNKQAQAEVKGSAETLSQSVLNIFKKKWDINSPSKASEELSKFFVKGIPIGIKKEEKNAISQAEKTAKNILETFDFSNIDTNFKNMGTLNFGNLTKDIIDSTKMVFSTPQIVFNVQEMNKENLDIAFNYINRKFGSAY